MSDDKKRTTSNSITLNGWILFDNSQASPFVLEFVSLAHILNVIFELFHHSYHVDTFEIQVNAIH